MVVEADQEGLEAVEQAIAPRGLAQNLKSPNTHQQKPLQLAPQ